MGTWQLPRREPALGVAPGRGTDTSRRISSRQLSVSGSLSGTRRNDSSSELANLTRRLSQCARREQPTRRWMSSNRHGLRMSNNLLVSESEPEPETWPRVSPRPLTEHEIRKLYEPVLYVVYEARDSDGTVLYVGRTWRLLRRLGEHSRVARWVAEVDVVKLHHCPCEDHMVNLASIRQLGGLRRAAGRPERPPEQGELWLRAQHSPAQEAHREGDRTIRKLHGRSCGGRHGPDVACGDRDAGVAG